MYKPSPILTMTRYDGKTHMEMKFLTSPIVQQNFIPQN